MRSVYRLSTRFFEPTASQRKPAAVVMYSATCFPACPDVFAAPTFFRSLMVRLALTRLVKRTNCTVTSLDLPGHRVEISKDTTPPELSDSILWHCGGCFASQPPADRRSCAFTDQGCVTNPGTDGEICLTSWGLNGCLLRATQPLSMRGQIHSIDLTIPRLPGIILGLSKRLPEIGRAHV